MELKQSGDTLNEKKVEHKKEVQSLKDELRGEREFYKQERSKRSFFS